MRTLESLQGAQISFGQRRLEAGGQEIAAPAPVSSERRLTRLEPMDVYCAFVAPIRGGAGPYLAFYFASYHHFSAACIGLLLGAMTLAFGLCQIPAGLIVDRFSCRKQIATLVLIAVAWSLSVTGNFGQFPVLLGAQILMGMACSFFGPLAASFSVGLVDRQQLNLRLGRNEISCHTGNIITGILLGVGLHLADSHVIVAALIACCLFAMLALIFLEDRTQTVSELGGSGASACTRSGIRSPSNAAPLQGAKLSFVGGVKSQVAEAFAGFANLYKVSGAKSFLAAAVMYSFANAAMLPLMIQYISRAGGSAAAVRLPCALLIAELVMIPVCTIATVRSSLGRKPLLFASFALLATRGICFSLIKNADLLVWLQVLDGMSAGIFTFLATLMVADLTRKSGRLSSTYCALMLITTSTNAISDFSCGAIASRIGYQTTFLVLAGIAVAGAWVTAAFVPETAELTERRSCKTYSV